MEDNKKTQDELRESVKLVHQTKDVIFASVKEIVRKAGGFLEISDDAVKAIVIERGPLAGVNVYRIGEIGALRIGGNGELQYFLGRGRGFRRFWDDDDNWQSLEYMEPEALLFTLMTLAIAVVASVPEGQ